MKTLNLVDLNKSDIKWKSIKFPDGQQNIVIIDYKPEINGFYDNGQLTRIPNYNKSVTIKYCKTIKCILMEYKTLDDHIMKEGEIMWRVNNTSNHLFKEPLKVMYHHTTGYNMIEEPINGNPNHTRIIGNNGQSPFPQKHFYSKEKAIEYLKNNNE